jgi:hypothetical protein
MLQSEDKKQGDTIMKAIFRILAALVLCAPVAKGQAELIGGRTADPKEFPASVYASMGGAACTATVVGERVLFIAAHCVDNGKKASFTVGPNRYTSTCTHAADYKNNSTADWALCLTDKVVTGIPYENLNTDPTAVKVGDEILLTGYGCVRQGGGGGNDGTYRIGEAKVSKVGKGDSAKGDNDIVAKNGAALCFGERVMISINSRGNIRDTSYLSSVSTPRAKGFISIWSAAKGVKLCGYHADAKGCRDAKPDPTDPCEAEKAALADAEKALQECKASVQ